jgi:hypothetical protein
MSNFAIIENGKVINVAISESEYANQQGWVALPEGFGIGCDYINGQFVDNRPKPDPVPEPTTPTKEELLEQLNAITAQIQALT